MSGRMEYQVSVDEYVCPIDTSRVLVVSGRVFARYRDEGYLQSVLYTPLFWLDRVDGVGVRIQ